MTPGYPGTTYSALTKVSLGYSDQGGRFPTCYSPVRRSVSIAEYLARLACIRHAASVYPEPGSNSLEFQSWSKLF